MKIILSHRVQRVYPDLKFAFFRLSDFADYASDADARVAETQITASLANRYDRSISWEETAIGKAYIGFYTSMGLNGRKCSNPIQQAYRFVGREYKAKSRLIDTAMEIEYLKGVSLQLYDYRRVGPSVHVDVAEQQLNHIGHEGKSSRCRIGELVTLSDEGLIHCPSLGNASSFALTPETGCVLLRAMLVPGIEPKLFEEAIDEIWSAFKPEVGTYVGGPLASGCLGVACW